MPNGASRSYVKSIFRSGSSTRRAPIRRKPRGPAIKTKKTVRIAVAKKSRVDRNARAISRLRMSLHGPLQKNMVVTSSLMNPSSLKPLLFDLTDFTRSDPITNLPQHGGYVWSLNNAGAAINVSGWQIPPLAGSNVFTRGFQQDKVNGGQYMALSNYVTIELEPTNTSGISNCYVRVQVFRVKPNRTYNYTNPGEDVEFPKALSQCKHLAEFASGCYLPQKFFHVYTDKTVVFNSRSANNNLTPSGTLNKKYVRVKLPHRKLIKQRVTGPETQSLPNVQNQLPEPAEGYFGPTERNQGDMIWCLISCSDRDDNLPNVSCKMRSLRCWRDPTGGYY